MSLLYIPELSDSSLGQSLVIHIIFFLLIHVTESEFENNPLE